MFKAARVDHLSADQLPPLADYDTAKFLKKTSYLVSVGDDRPLLPWLTCGV